MFNKEEIAGRVNNQSFNELMINSRIITEYMIVKDALSKKLGLFTLSKGDPTCLVLDKCSIESYDDSHITIGVGLVKRDQIISFLEILFPEESKKEIMERFFNLDLRKHELNFDTAVDGKFSENIGQLLVPDYALVEDVKFEFESWASIGCDSGTITVDFKIFDNSGDEEYFNEDRDFDKAITFWGRSNFYKFAKPIYDDIRDTIDNIETGCGPEVDLSDDLSVYELDYKSEDVAELFGEDNIEEYLDEYSYSEDIDNDSPVATDIELEDNNYTETFEKDNEVIKELDLTKPKESKNG